MDDARATLALEERTWSQAPRIQRSNAQSWAIKHNGGFLGYANSREEAQRIVEDLRHWLAEKGGRSQVVVEKVGSHA
jgi:hypothetical protein